MVETGYRIKYVRTFYIVLIGILAGTLLAFSTPVAAADTKVSVVVSETDVVQGDNFTASINIANVTGFDAAQYDITYDPAVIQVVAVENGLIGGLEIPVDAWASVNSTTIRVINNIYNIQNLNGSGYLSEILFSVVGATGTSSNITLSNGLLGNKDAEEITPVTWEGGYVQVVESGGNGGNGGGGGGGGGGGSSGTTNFLAITTSEGRFEYEAIAESSDGKVWLVIPENTIARNRTGQRLRYVNIKVKSADIPTPEDHEIVTLTYNIGPAGATFTPAAYLVFDLDDADIPDGISEDSLMIVKVRDGEWVELKGCTIDPDANTIQVLINDLSTFTVMARTTPASFEISEMKIIPYVIYPEESVTIGVTVINTGDMAGSEKFTLKINDLEVQTQTVNLDGGERLTISFTTIPEATGVYSVDVNGFASAFTVTEPEPEGTVAEVVTPPPEPASFTISDLSITPSEIYPSEEVTISAVVENSGGSEGSYIVVFKVDDIQKDMEVITLAPGASEKLYFYTTKDKVGSYTIDVNGQTGQFSVIVKPIVTTPAKTETAEPSKNWLTTVIIFSSLVIIGIILIFSYRKFTKPKEPTDSL